MFFLFFVCRKPVLFDAQGLKTKIKTTHLDVLLVAKQHVAMIFSYECCKRCLWWY